MSEKQNFTEGKIVGPLIKFAIPLFFALLLQSFYGAVDLWVVGKFASSADVAAVSTGSWLIWLFTSLATGISMGTTVLIGRNIGRKDPEEAGHVVGASIVFFAILAIVLTLITAFFTPFMVRIMQTPEESVEACRAYVYICGFGFIPIVAFNVLGSIFRGIGDSKIPFIAVLIACIINVGGDLFCVCVLHMGAAGAAAATVAAQAVSVVICLVIILRRAKNGSLPFQLEKKYVRWDGERTGLILKLGVPVALQDILVTMSFLVIISMVNSLGVTESAGVGIAEKLCGFIMLVPNAFSQAIATFTAQNMGAGKPDRARQALRYAMMISFVLDIVLAYLTFFHGDLLAWIFSSDASVVAAAAEYLKAYSIDCLMTAFMFCFLGYFNGCGDTTFVMLQGILSAFLIRIPVCFAMMQLEPVSLFMVGLSTPCATIVQLIACIIFYLIKKKKQS